MATWKKVIVSGSNISQLNNDSLFIHTGSDGVALSGSFSGSFQGDGSGLTGVTAAGTLSSSAQIADDISGSLSAAHLNSKIPGLLSGSAQIGSDISGSFTDASSSIATDIDNLQSDSGSFSTRVTDLESFSSSLDATFATEAEVNTATASLSSSLATDIAGLVTDSGSFSTRVEDLESFSSSLDATFATEAEVNTATASLSSSLATDIATNVTDIAALESFSSSLSTTVITYTGSFSGDGSGLTGLTVDQNATVTASFSNAATASITHNFDSDNIIVVVYDDQNEQFIPSTIKSISSDVVEVHFTPNATGRAIVARGGHIVSGSIPFENIIAKPANLVSGSGQILVVTDGTGVISGSSQIAELGAGIISGAAQIEELGDITVSGSFSGSFVGDGSGLTGVTAAGTLSSSAQIADDISGSFTSTSSSIATDIATLDSSKADKTAVTGAFAASSGSFSTRVTTLEDAVGAGGLLSSSAQIANDISGAFGADSSSLASRITENEGDISAIEAYTSSLKTAITLSGANVTINGNLEVSGTQTIVDSTTVEIGDNILALNGTGAANGGIEVNDPNGPASGSLLWDGTNNYWKAGGQGSEEKILLAAGDNVLSGSTQIADDISGSLSATAIAALEAGILSSSAQIANDISGSFTDVSSSIATDIANLDSSKADKTAITGAFADASGSFSTRVTDLETFSSSLDNTFVTETELNTATSSLSSSLATDIATNLDSITTLENKTLVSGSAQLASDISGSFTSTSSSIATDIATNLASITTLENKTLVSGSSQIASDISGSFVQASSSIATDIDALQSDSGSFSTRVTDLETFSSSLDASFATEAELNTATASLSASLATDIAQNKSDLENLTSGELNSGSFNVTLDPVTGSIGFTEGLEIGDVYDQGNGTTDIRVPNGASWLELNYADSDFIYLDGTDAGINLDNTYEWKFFGATGTMTAPGEIRTTGTISGSKFVLTGGQLLSGSAQLNTIAGVADAISGSFTNASSSIASDIDDLQADSGSFSTRVTDLETFSSSLDATFATEAELNTATASLSSSLATDIATNLASINTLEGKTLVSASVLDSTGQGLARLTTNGVAATAVDLGLDTTDSPTFAGLTVTGDLTVTGNTIEAQVTNLNVEDKYILLNSGSTSGDSGIVFGGADGVANSGVGLFWDTSYNSNDGRLGIVNSIAAGATGDQTPSYHIAGVFEGTDAAAQAAQADHTGNIRVEGGEIYIYV